MIGSTQKSILANIAVDYSKVFRKGLVSANLFPRIEVQRATGKFPKFSRDDLHYVPDTELATSKSAVVEVEQTHSTQEFACMQNSVKEAIAISDIEQADGAFPRVISHTTQRLAGKLELAQEKRVADMVKALTGDATTSLSGTGTADTNVWNDGNGDPVGVITDRLDAMVIRGNTIVIPRTVWKVLQFHPSFADKLPTTAFQTVTQEAVAAILGVDQVLIANGAIKQTKAGSIDSIWGNTVVCAYVDLTGDKDMPTAGRTLLNEYVKNGAQGWIVNVWDEQGRGINGVRWYQVAHEVDELVVTESLIHVIKDVV